MKTILLLFCLVVNCFGIDAERIADAVYRVEGGSKTKWPYGIKCHRHEPSVARRMCIRTIENCHADWMLDGKPGDFREYLADRYVPPSVDAAGNRNWKRNIRKLLK